MHGEYTSDDSLCPVTAWNSLCKILLKGFVSLARMKNVSLLSSSVFDVIVKTSLNNEKKKSSIFRNNISETLQNVVDVKAKKNKKKH